MNYYSDFDDYLLEMVESVKVILYQRHNDIFDRLDFYNDHIFLEPLLFAYLHQKDPKWLDCIIYGYEENRKAKIDVFSNTDGVIYIPRIGYFFTNLRNTNLKLSVDNGNYILEFETESIRFDFETLFFLESGIEIQKHTHPLLERLFYNGTESLSDDLFITNQYVQHINNLENAFKILKKANQDHFMILTKCLKRIMIYSATYPNSFASLTAQNMIFFNVNQWDSAMYFVDHLSHEGAHLTFNTLTYESKTRLFKFPFYASFAEVTGKSNEHSNLYLRFHGLFTFVEIIKSLIHCLTDVELPSILQHEAKGRLAFQLRRFSNSLKSFENLDVFEKEGVSWYNYFKKTNNNYYSKFGYLIDTLDLSDQSYDFNSLSFNRLNPLN